MELILMAFLLAGSAFFSASETALFSVPRYQLRRLREKHGVVGRTITFLLEDQRSLLVTVLLGNMFVNVCYCSLAVLFGARLSVERGVGIFVAVDAVALAMLIVFGEVLPKSVAVNLPLTVARLTAPFLLMFRTAILPLRVVFEVVVRVLTAAIPAGRESAGKDSVTIQDLANLVEVGLHHGLLTPRENKMLQEVIEFGTIEAREVMTPRIDVTLHDICATRERLLALIRRSRRSKIPLYRDEPDNIVGVLHTKDVFLYPDSPVDSLVRPVAFFPETAKIDSILRALLAQQQTIAMVVDEYGGLEGIVTLEDIVEEVVGEIEDEFDKERPKVRRLSGERYLLQGSLPLREWNEIAGTALRDERIETVGGLVAMHLDRLPRKGDSVELHGYKFTVLRVVKEHTKVILAEKLHLPEGGRKKE